MRIPNNTRFRAFSGAGIIFLICLVFTSCRNTLSDARTVELIRVFYKQQNTMEGAGTWLIDSVIVGNKVKIKDDSLPSYKVTAYISGLYKVPVFEDAPEGLTEKFFDTLQFVARKRGEVWIGKEWTVIGAKHE